MLSSPLIGPGKNFFVFARTFILTCHRQRIWEDCGSHVSIDLIKASSLSVTIESGCWIFWDFITSTSRSRTQSYESFFSSQRKASPICKTLFPPVIMQILSKGMPNRFVLYVQSSKRTCGNCRYKSMAEGRMQKSRVRFLVALTSNAGKKPLSWSFYRIY